MEIEQKIDQPQTKEERRAALMEALQAAAKSPDAAWYESIQAQLLALDEEERDAPDVPLGK